jgi:hypothetical protein
MVETALSTRRTEWSCHRRRTWFDGRGHRGSALDLRRTDATTNTTGFSRAVDMAISRERARFVDVPLFLVVALEYAVFVCRTSLLARRAGHSSHDTIRFAGLIDVAISRRSTLQARLPHVLCIANEHFRPIFVAAELARVALLRDSTRLVVLVCLVLSNDIDIRSRDAVHLAFFINDTTDLRALTSQTVLPVPLLVASLDSRAVAIVEAPLSIQHRALSIITRRDE